MADSAALVGTTLGRRFRLESHLGSGGMGARDIRRYSDEARVLASL